MGKLPITKKSQNNQHLSSRVTLTATAEVVTEIAARLLDRWTQKELEALVHNKEFVCVDVGNNLFRVGKFLLKKRKNHWLVKSPAGPNIHEFMVAPAAVFYCLYESRALFHKAQEFMRLDTELCRLTQEITDYVHALDLAVKNNNSFKQDLYIARLSNSRPRLENLKTNMQKTIYGAKYSKVWETKNHETARTRN